MQVFFILANCNCDSLTDIPPQLVKVGAKVLSQALVDMLGKNQDPKGTMWDCENPTSLTNETRDNFNMAVNTSSESSKYIVRLDKHAVPLITAPIKIDVKTKNKSTEVEVGTWNPVSRFTQSPSYTPKEIRNFFRIGIQDSIQTVTFIFNCCFL